MSQPTHTALVSKFLESQREIDAHRTGKAIVTANGQTLSIAAVVAAARFGAKVTLDGSPDLKKGVDRSVKIVEDKVNTGRSVYGISTGYGGSADTRSHHHKLLQLALLQHQHIGVLPSSTNNLPAYPLLDPLSSTSMPESWVRGTMLIRMNSLVRGHSGVRWGTIEKIEQMLDAGITPLIPQRSSISASGDLSPLSYLAGSLIGNPSIRVFDGPPTFGPRKIVSSAEALKRHKIAPITLGAKEGLGILNGTAVSASVASLALHDAVHLSLLAHIATAMGTEALLGTRDSFEPFLHVTARPHPGQIESAQIVWSLLRGSKLAHLHEVELSLDEDRYHLRQDRYPLRTAPQFLGPQLEDLLSAYTSITRECNSTTDNPLIEPDTGIIYHGGNFQAMAVSNSMEKTRLALHHIGKLLFSQCTELLNPAFNNGMPPSAASTDPSLNYQCKGLDIAMAAYTSELGFLANPVTTHIQSAEMHNQAVNSLALISGRATLQSLEVLSFLVSSYLYVLCQALDLRALQKELLDGVDAFVSEQMKSSFGFLPEDIYSAVHDKVKRTMHDRFEKTSTMDGEDRMSEMARAGSTILLEFLSDDKTAVPASKRATVSALVPSFRHSVATRGSVLLQKLRQEYLGGARGKTPASALLGKTKAIYEFVRIKLGIPMHGSENLYLFRDGPGVIEPTIGQHVSLIHEAIRDGVIQPVVASVLSECQSNGKTPSKL